jgi:hypothetical protein
MITVGMYKLAFIAAGGLLVAGALMGRAARERRLSPASPETEKQLGVGGDVHVGSERERREHEKARRDRPHDH